MSDPGNAASMESSQASAGPDPVSPWLMFVTFLRLGCSSFGGPIAHLGYFREEFVTRRKWLDDAAFTDIVALCQFLPGPASSQVGFSIGLLRGGAAGALAAWSAFTLPSALLMFAVARGHSLLRSGVGIAVVHALELVAVAVIAQAIWGMQRSLAPDISRMAIAALAAAVVLLSTHSWGQLAGIALGGLLGLLVCGAAERRGDAGELHVPVTRPVACAALAIFAGLLALPTLCLATRYSPLVALFQAFYRSGALVFGGGHVVLPLLQAATVNRGWIDDNTFLAGYAAAQALPGPLFSFAAYLGALVQPVPYGGFAGAVATTTPAALGAVIALVAIFLPGLLLVVGVLPFWGRLRANRRARALFAGVNASVVGVLFAALCHPVWSSAIHKPADFLAALAAFLALVAGKAPPWLVVLAAAALGALWSLGR